MSDEQKAENLILYDWFSFTLLDDSYDPLQVAVQLGLDGIRWESIKGMHGYQDRLYCEGISIHHNGSCPGVWVEMSGQGCRFYETVSGIAWNEVFSWILDQPASHITRVDVAFDDHTGILSLDDMIEDIQKDCYLTSFHGCKVEREFGKEYPGTSIYFGSPQSKIRIRIYDKAAERKIEDKHWIRCEMQLRDDRAKEFIKAAISGDELGIVYAGVLIRYLKFVVPTEDSNRSRWPLSDYWDKLIGDVCEIALWSSPGLEYNLQKLDNFVFSMAGRAINTTINIYGLNSFMKSLKNRCSSSSPKYQSLVEHAKVLGLSKYIDL